MSTDSSRIAELEAALAETLSCAECGEEPPCGNCYQEQACLVLRATESGRAALAVEVEKLRKLEEDK